MSRGMPSMVALLGLLAVAGYQNKDTRRPLCLLPSAGIASPGSIAPGLAPNSWTTQKMPRRSAGAEVSCL